MPKRPDIEAGGYYNVTASGRIGPRIGPELPAGAPDPEYWICRRTTDFNVPPPEAAGRAPCSRCGAEVCFNPARTITAAKLCMQCAGIVPLPFPT